MDGPLEAVSKTVKGASSSRIQTLPTPESRSDDGRDYGRCSYLDGEDLASHAAAAELRRLAEDQHPAPPSRMVNERGARRARCAREDAVDLGEKDEQACADQNRDLGRERIVVPERDLVGCGGVVLVQDRHDTENEQSEQRFAGVDIRNTIGHVAAVSSTCAARTPSRPRACAHEFWSRAWPSADAACSFGTERGRRSRPRYERPSAIAPRRRRQPDSPLATIAAMSARPRTQDAPPHRPRDAHDETGSELDDDRHLRWVPSPTIRVRRSHRSRYVTGPRGPGTQSTLIPVSGAPVSSKPSAKRVGAFQNAAVPL